MPCCKCSLTKRQVFCSAIVLVSLALLVMLTTVRDAPPWRLIPAMPLYRGVAVKGPPPPPPAPDTDQLQAGPVSVVSAPQQPAVSSSRFPGFQRTAGADLQLAEIRRADLGALSHSQLEDLYFTIVQQLHIHCPSSGRIGSSIDGGWDVCFSEPFDIRKSRPQCVAFSFGINYIWDYDDQLADKYRCLVYMFDPSMNRASDHQRKTTSWFYLTGLSSNNSVAPNGWRMRTLCSLFKEHGCSSRSIDILKVDIEFWEWESFEQAMRDGCLSQVKQVLFESHTSEMLQRKSDYSRFVRVWLGLFDLGFRTWKWHENPVSVFYPSSTKNRTRACCFEHYMINTKFL